MRRPFRLLVCLMLLGLCLRGAAWAQGAGDTSSSPHQGSGNALRIWYALPDRYAPRFQALLAQYQQTHPTVAVEGRNFESMEALHAALVSGDLLPHIALIDSTWQDERIKQGKLVAADDMMSKISDMCRITLKADTFPCMFAAVLRGDKVWTTPAFALSHALLYDRDVLSAAGIKVPPHKWADLVLMGRKLTQPGQWAFSFPSHLSAREMGRMLEVFSWQACLQGGVDDHSVDSPESTRALQYLVDLSDKYKIAPPGGMAERAQSAMFVGTVEDLLDGQAGGRHLDAAPLPGLISNAADIDVFTLAQFNVDPHLADRNFQAIEYLTDFQQMLVWSECTPYIPADKQITLSPGYFQYMGEHSGLKSFVTQLRCAHVDAPHLSKVDEILGLAAHTALDSKMSTHDALAAARQQTDALQTTSPSASHGDSGN